MKTKRETILFSLILVYLTCYFIKLFGFPDLLVLVLGAVFCLILLLKQKKFRLDIGVCLIAIMMFSYCIIVFGIRAVAIMMPYVPIVLYVLSHYLAKEIKRHENSEIQLSKVVYCLVFGHAVHGILNSYMYFAGYRGKASRHWFDVWEQCMMPGTQLTIYYLAVFAVLFPAIIYFKRKKWANSTIILVTLFFIYASLATRTRTTLLVLVLVFVGQAILYLILERKKVMPYITPKKIGIFFISMIVIIMLLFFALRDNEMIRIFIDNLDKDGGILNNIRFRVQRQALSQIFDYPFGGNQMIMDLNMAHNAWLDIANEAGVIPFLSFAVYTIWTIYELFRFVIKREIDTEIKLMMVGIYVAFFLYYTVEPALKASVHFLSPWILVNGLIHGYITKD